MPVQRSKGLSEYKRNYKWRKLAQSRPCSPSYEQKCRWAGLRSDELGIAREPNFISKRRVPYYKTQISKSFEWNGDNGWEKNKTSEFEVPQLLKLHTSQDKDDIEQEKIKTPDAPRFEKMHSSSVVLRPKPTAESKEKSPLKTQVNENGILAPAKKDLSKIDSGINKVLQRRAGMNISRSSSFPRSSEYQRQFVWKSPQKISPLLSADQVIDSASKSIPAFKSPAIIPETEYRRRFKASPALKEKWSLEEKECPAAEPVGTCLGKKNEKKETFSENSSKQGKSEVEQKHHKQKHKPFCLHRSFRKMNTEYRSKFLSPAQYVYKDGAWLRIRRGIPDQVKELREKAETYRQRIRGTHFSRDHLNQILSDNNRLWDLSSDSSTEETISDNVRALDLAGVREKQSSPVTKLLPQSELSVEEFHQNNTEKLGMSDAVTLPVRRRLVWGESDNAEQLGSQTPALEEAEKKQNKLESTEVENLEEIDKDIKTEILQEENVSSPDGRSDSSSVSSKMDGRIPTPQLRTLGGMQRTHHDLTTPAVGGAVLVSPSKVKSSLPVGRESSEKHPLPHSQVLREDLKRKSNRDEGEVMSLGPPSAAGLKTLDPLPLRTEKWSSLDAASIRTAPTSVPSEQAAIVPVLKSGEDAALPYWSPSCRIQGTLRDPEFQHNGNVATPQRSWLQLPLQERNYDEDDDRLSQLSARSAASSSFASQVLERAQRRKENFWSKM